MEIQPYSYFNITIDVLLAMYKFFDSPDSEITHFIAFVLARYSKSDERINSCLNVATEIQDELSDCIKYLAFNPAPRVRELAVIALKNIGDSHFERYISIDSWILTIDIKEPQKILGYLKKAEIDMKILGDLRIDLNYIFSSLSALGLSEGAKLSLLGAIVTLRNTIEHAKQKMSKIAKKEHKELDSKPTGQETNTSRIDVFISYSWADKDAVKRLKEILESSKLKCWIDDGKMHGGNQLFAEIEQGISSAYIFLACISDSYGNSENCKREVLLATDRKKLIIPVIISQCNPYPPRGDMGPLLAGKLYIDMRDSQLLVNNSDQLIRAVTQSL